MLLHIWLCWRQQQGLSEAADPKPVPGGRHCWNVSLQRPYAWQGWGIAVSGLMYPVCSIWKSLVPYGISLVGVCQGVRTENWWALVTQIWKQKTHQPQSLADVVVCILRCFSEHWVVFFFFFDVRWEVGKEKWGRGWLAGFVNVLVTRSQWKDVNRIPSLPFPPPRWGKDDVVWLDGNL